MATFSTIVTDFPFSFQDSLQQSDTKRGALANYNTMSIKDLKALPIKDLIDPEGSILCLWVPSALLKEGIELMESYNFHLKQNYIWIKSKQDPLKDLQNQFNKILKTATKDKNFSNVKDLFLQIKNNFSLNNTLGFFMGHLFRQTHEICLIGISNNKIYKKLKNKSRRSVSFAPNLKHSAKPSFLQDSLDLMFEGNKIELFARRPRKGWLTLGNEVEMTLNEDINISLNKAKNLTQAELHNILNAENQFELWQNLK
jgi:N6-adenosine-specific RNA methylase IME4